METLEQTKEKVEIENLVDELMSDSVFTIEQKPHILSGIFNQNWGRNPLLELDEEQSRLMQELAIRYIKLKNNGHPSILFQLINSESNNLKRYFASAEDLVQKGMFDFSPVSDD